MDLSEFFRHVVIFGVEPVSYACVEVFGDLVHVVPDLAEVKNNGFDFLGIDELELVTFGEVAFLEEGGDAEVRFL